LLAQYWDDPADAARPGEGTLLPLWRFAAGAARGRAVTALAWSPRHWDLFAAGYGSFDPGRPLTGALCCHSLKNPSRPDLHLPLPSGVLSLDFHPAAPRLLALGCQDGSVHVVDAGAAAPAAALRAASPPAARHAEAVWEVKWVPAAAGESLRFCAVSGDGHVTQWELGPGRELARRDLLVLAGGGGGGAAGPGAPAGCCCLDAHPAQPSLVVVGTQEGDVFKCCTDTSAGALAAGARVARCFSAAQAARCVCCTAPELRP
jgi:dynein intermediate chain 1